MLKKHTYQGIEALQKGEKPFMSEVLEELK